MVENVCNAEECSVLSSVNDSDAEEYSMLSSAYDSDAEECSALPSQNDSDLCLNRDSEHADDFVLLSANNPSSSSTQESFKDSCDVSNKSSKVDPPPPSSNSDTDDEFDRILTLCRNKRLKGKETVHHGNAVNPKHIQHEYDILKEIEALNIHANDAIHLEYLGEVDTHVDCLLVIKSGSSVVLNLDTVLFDAERNSIGKIYDVLGTVSNAKYTVRFNSVKEAEVWKIGTKVYYAPDADEFTEVLLEKDLREKGVDSAWDGEGECPEDELCFSDDEREQEYKRNKNMKNKKIDHQPEGHSVAQLRDTRKRNWIPSINSDNASEFPENQQGMPNQSGRYYLNYVPPLNSAHYYASPPHKFSPHPNVPSPQRFYAISPHYNEPRQHCVLIQPSYNSTNIPYCHSNNFRFIPPYPFFNHPNCNRTGSYASEYGQLSGYPRHFFPYR